mmetsp:Transcript_18675/g.38855  ORF Transcript_18675/g.38855 Transcript_18675/m.38855 type:complete len:293 (-) Transcript_18675:766-1644(-)
MLLVGLVVFFGLLPLLLLGDPTGVPFGVPPVLLLFPPPSPCECRRLSSEDLVLCRPVVGVIEAAFLCTFFTTTSSSGECFLEDFQIPNPSTRLVSSALPCFTVNTGIAGTSLMHVTTSSNFTLPPSKKFRSPCSRTLSSASTLDTSPITFFMANVSSDVLPNICTTSLRTEPATPPALHSDSHANHSITSSKCWSSIKSPSPLLFLIIILYPAFSSSFPISMTSFCTPFITQIQPSTPSSHNSNPFENFLTFSSASPSNPPPSSILASQRLARTKSVSGSTSIVPSREEPIV